MQKRAVSHFVMFFGNLSFEVASFLIKPITTSKLNNTGIMLRD